MDIKDLFEKIIDNDDIIKILKELNVHHIVDKGDYITCGQPTGDNPSSIIVYKDNLWVNAYTRDIRDKGGYSNLVSLVSYINKTYYTQSIKWICDVCGYEYYEKPIEKTGMLKFLDYIEKECQNDVIEEDEKSYLEPIDENILKYYGKYSNQLFLEDGIDMPTQRSFEVGYDLATHSITIPIRDELGTLVGVKARLFKREVEPYENKYYYLMPCAKSKVLYGLHKTMPYIQRSKKVYVVESEKSVMKLWCNNIRNTVSISGHSLSKTQVKKLIQLGVEEIVFVFDQDVARLENGRVDLEWYIKEASYFLECQKVYAMIDVDNSILKKKESPVDNLEKFKLLESSKILLNESEEDKN